MYVVRWENACLWKDKQFCFFLFGLCHCLTTVSATLDVLYTCRSYNINYLCNTKKKTIDCFYGTILTAPRFLPRMVWIFSHHHMGTVPRTSHCQALSTPHSCTSARTLGCCVKDACTEPARIRRSCENQIKTWQAGNGVMSRQTRNPLLTSKRLPNTPGCR